MDLQTTINSIPKTKLNELSNEYVKTMVFDEMLATLDDKFDKDFSEELIGKIYDEVDIKFDNNILSEMELQGKFNKDGILKAIELYFDNPEQFKDYEPHIDEVLNEKFGNENIYDIADYLYDNFDKIDVDKALLKANAEMITQNYLSCKIGELELLNTEEGHNLVDFMSRNLIDNALNDYKAYEATVEVVQYSLYKEIETEIGTIER